MIKEFNDLEEYINSEIFGDIVDLYTNFFGGIIANCYIGKSGKFMTLVHEKFPDIFVTTQAGGYIVVTGNRK
jgi:hypothetical protein